VLLKYWYVSVNNKVAWDYRMVFWLWRVTVRKDLERTDELSLVININSYGDKKNSKSRKEFIHNPGLQKAWNILKIVESLLGIGVPKIKSETTDRTKKSGFKSRLRKNFLNFLVITARKQWSQNLENQICEREPVCKCICLRELWQFCATQIG
jgi:hypothetical protein